MFLVNNLHVREWGARAEGRPLRGGREHFLGAADSRKAASEKKLGQLTQALSLPLSCGVRTVFGDDTTHTTAWPPTLSEKNCRQMYINTKGRVFVDGE